MKYLIPVLLTGATIIVAVTTALAQAHGAFNGRVPWTPYLYGYGAAAVLFLIAAAMAVNAHRQERPRSAYPALDFEFTPETTTTSVAADYVPKLMLTIVNRGDSAIQDVRMQATEYTLQSRAAIVAMSKMGGEAHIAQRIGPKNASTPQNVRDLMPIRLEKVGIREHGISRPHPVNENFYALRFPFVEAGSRRRYVFYKVIEARPPYLLAIESPFGYGYAKGSAGLDDSVIRNWFEGPRRLILDDQRNTHANFPEEEYLPSGKAMQQP
jgi:hypothetical protein